MKNFILSFALAIGAFTAMAQQTEQINKLGCGHVATQEELKEIYDFVQHNPAAYQHKGTATFDTIPLTIHIVGNDNGNGFYSIANVMKDVCQLNERYAPVSFYFYVQWPIRYISNTSYYEHEFNGGYAMMNGNNVNGTVNIYYVNDPAGNCGYYAPGPDGVAIKKSCAGDKATTITHELGHFFSLPHTFSGWENGNTPSNPEAVRRTGTGTNCNSAGDGFCDTYADYYGSRWSCPMTTTKVDQFGDLYKLDSSMYMSYSSDVCQSQFSAQQIAKMQNNLATANKRAAIRNAVPPAHSPLGATNVAYPVDTMYSNVQKIMWNKAPGAEYYFVQVGITSLNNSIRQSAFVSDTSLNISFALINNLQYTVMITPVNAFDFCGTNVKVDTFVYTSRNGNVSVANTNNEGSAISIFPNPYTNGQMAGVNLNKVPVGNYNLVLTSTTGAVVYQHNIDVTNSDKYYTELSLPQIPAGIYFARISNESLSIVHKLVVQ